MWGLGYGERPDLIGVRGDIQMVSDGFRRFRTVSDRFQTRFRRVSYPFRSFSEESAWQVAGCCCCLRFGLAAALLPRPAGRHPKPFWFKVQGFLGLRWRRVLPAWGGSGRPPAVDGVMWALSYRSRGRRRAGITSCAWLGERCAHASRLWLRVPARFLRRRSRCLLRWPHRAWLRLR